MTLEGGGAASRPEPDAPNPPVGAWACHRTYSHAALIRGSAGSAPSWSRKMICQTVPRYFGA